MSRKVAKIALVSINGKGYPANPDGTESNVGIAEREPVAADLNPNAGYSETPVAGRLTFQPIARADFDPIDLTNTKEATITIEYDNGAKFTMANATCASPATKGGGDTHWACEFFGDPWEKS